MRDSSDYPRFARNYFIHDPKEVEILLTGFTELRGCIGLYKIVLQVFGGLSYPTETTIAIGFNVCVRGMVEDGAGVEWLRSAEVVSRHAFIWCAHINRAVLAVVTAPFLDDLVGALLLFPDVPAVDGARLLTLRNLLLPFVISYGVDMPSFIRNWDEMLNTICECDAVGHRHQLLEEYHALNALLRNRSDCEILLKIACVSWSYKPQILGWTIRFHGMPEVDNTVYWSETLKVTLLLYLRRYVPGSALASRGLVAIEENSEMLALLQSLLLLLPGTEAVT